MLNALKKAVDVIKQWHGPDCWDIYYERSPEMKEIREAIATYDNVPPEIVESMTIKCAILLNAIVADPTSKEKISYRIMAAHGIPKSEEAEVQVIIEVCLNKKHFLEEGDIEIVSDRQYNGVSYKLIEADKIVECYGN